MRVLVDGQTLATPEVHRGIGRVVLNLLEELAGCPALRVKVAVPVETALDALPGWLRNAVETVVLLPGPDWDEGFHALQRWADVVWHPNPLMPNVRAPVFGAGPKHWVTVYDLIPLVMRDIYIDRWPEHIRDDYLARLHALAGSGAGLAFISESARSDFRDAFPDTVGEMIVVPLAVDHGRFWAWQIPDAGRDPFVLYTGGMDPRKNVDFALDAFAALRAMPGTDPRLRLKVVCSMGTDDRARLMAHADRVGIADHFDAPGFVPDDELARLYRDAACFVFPSRYEGFGLPVLEALASGVPVACARNSSLPEVAEGHAHWFDANDVQGAAAAMSAALRQAAGPDWPAARVAASLHARGFTWAAAGHRMVDAFIGSAPVRESKDGAPFRPRIGLVTPWPPLRSGIADYSRSLAEALTRYADVTIFVDGDEADPVGAADPQVAGLRVRPLDALPRERAGLDRVVYSVGNNARFHKGAWRGAWDNPDALVVHDIDLEVFAREAFGADGNRRYLTEPMRAAQALRPVRSEAWAGGHSPEPAGVPLVAALCAKSRVAFVHSRWQARRFPEDCPVRVLPHGTAAPDASRQGRGRQRLRELGFDPGREFVLGTFGFPTRFKRIPSVLRALAELRKRGYPVRLLIGGDRPHPQEGLEDQIEDLGLAEAVTITGYLDDEAFEDLVAAVDVVIALRHPSVGETSGVVMRTLAAGVPCITSRYQQFAELPDRICWKADPDDREIPQLVEMLAMLLDEPRLRAQLGRNAALWAERYTRWDYAARLVVGALFPDPVPVARQAEPAGAEPAGAGP
ncbi:MAG TPA: glycosyltransferase [Azospirillaceae bacterium]|nr:glycosyltransferase [Azospirillaceae bacterium]